jgi:hypothetical protein
MPKRVVGTTEITRTSDFTRIRTLCFHDANLQNVVKTDFRKTQFQNRGEKGRQVSGFAGGTTESCFSALCEPANVRRMEHPEIASCCPAKITSTNVPPLSQLDEGSIGWDHRVPPQPDFNRLEVGENIEQS